ncbi:MAG: tyrosine-type recombinase/integrase [Gracilibacteraceae bacterium]|jgi:site-specific recombinase XerD|nr:tyrosine-type recombinase/integrase [Gracilibacteraceae bacterium]
MEKPVTTLESHIQAYLAYLRDEEKSRNTLSKYEYDLRRFIKFLTEAGGGEPDKAGALTGLTKEILRAYKDEISQSYAAVSVNSMLAAVNGFLSFQGMGDMHIKQLRIQHRVFCGQDEELDREEYGRILEAAAAEKKQSNLNLILQTICATGIRVGELVHITVEAVRAGRADVLSKGKARQILIPASLRRLLLEHIERKKLTTGSIFLTRSGRPVHRSNIWRGMKNLKEAAGVAAAKLFPHNLRRLFARVYYDIGKDLARLADILGHSDVRTTQIYIMSSGHEHLRQLDRMNLVARRA